MPPLKVIDQADVGEIAMWDGWTKAAFVVVGIAAVAYAVGIVTYPGFFIPLAVLLAEVWVFHKMQDYLDLDSVISQWIVAAVLFSGAVFAGYLYDGEIHGILAWLGVNVLVGAGALVIALIQNPPTDTKPPNWAVEVGAILKDLFGRKRKG